MFHKLLSPIPNATVFNKQTLNACCVPTLGYYPHFTHEQNKAPRLRALLKWWVWTKDPGLSAAKAHILGPAQPICPICERLLTVQLYWNGWNRDGNCQRANPTCRHKTECHGATRGHLLEADIDLDPLQQPRAQVSLSYGAFRSRAVSCFYLLY